MRKKKIMIVDDDILLAHTMDMCLSKRGHEVKAVYTGVDAVKSLFKEKPDLMVLDIGLPDCNGWFLAKLLGKLDWAEKIPIILMSILDPEREKIAEAKPYAYIQKPFDMGQLIGMVEKSLSEESNLAACSSP